MGEGPDVSGFLGSSSSKANALTRDILAADPVLAIICQSKTRSV